MCLWRPVVVYSKEDHLVQGLACQPALGVPACPLPLQWRLVWCSGAACAPLLPPPAHFLLTHSPSTAAAAHHKPKSPSVHLTP